MATISIPAFSLRRLETPFDKRPGYRNYVALVEVSDLPDLSQWRRLNVRDPKLTGSLPRKIEESFLSNPETFVFLNRGLVLAVQSVDFDNVNGLLKLTLTDPDLHGLLDGGHTYEIIKKNRDTLKEDGIKQYVRVELIEGFDPDELVQLVDARNSSNQVKDVSLMNLAQEFEQIKEAIKGKPYADRIAYKEYETFPNGDPKPIDVRELVSFLMVMDKDNFGPDEHPINAYRDKAACLRHFKESKKSFVKLYPLTHDILRLWDTIHLKLPELYNAVRGERGGVSGGKFGKLTGVAHLKEKAKGHWLEFLGRESRYIIPAGFKYPILAAFRAILEEKGRRYVWGRGIDPIDFFCNEVGKNIANTIGTFALQAQNPSKTGKSLVVWQSCYQSVEIAYLRGR